MRKNILKVFVLIITLTFLLTATTTLSAANNTENFTTDNNDLNKISKNSDNIITVSENVEVKSKNNTNNKNVNSEKTIINEKENTNSNINISVKKDTKELTKTTNIQQENTKTAIAMDIPLDKSRKIYFAMDHTSKKDQTICNNIVTKLKNEGFNVVRYRIGPNAMYQNMLYLYNNKIKNAIMFHLFNGVDPSNIREVAKNGNDNRGRIVRSRGNDVVLAWFYDASDAVHPGGKAYSYVKGSETGKGMSNPKNYMDQNQIRYICTSSDKGRHTSTADYTGTKTATEFIKLFQQETTTSVKSVNVAKNIVTVNGIVSSKYDSNIHGTVKIIDSNNNIIKNNIQVNKGTFNTSFDAKNHGIQKYTINYQLNNHFKSSSTNFNVNVPKNVTLSITQRGNTVGYTYLDILVLDDKTKKAEKDRIVYYKTSNGDIKSVKTNSSGMATVKVNTKTKDTYTIYCNDVNNKLLTSTTKYVEVKRTNPVISIKPLQGSVGQKITLTVRLKDSYNKNVKSGWVAFKINGKILKLEGNASNKINVTNGIVTITLTAKKYMQNAKLTVAYSGSSKHNKAYLDTTITGIK